MGMIEINRCYLDNAATTKVCPEAVKAAVRAMEEIYGNPSSLHRLGLEAENVMSDARRVIAGILDAQPGEILFTSGATESDNLALLGTAAAYRRTGNRIVSSAVEHPAVSACLDRLEEQGFEVVRIKPRENGEVCAQDFADAVNQKTWMVSCMQVNNETGLIFPIEQIARQVKAKNPKTLVHIDAAQGFCKLSLSVKKVPVDLISISGHKIHAPKGIGALYLRKGTRRTGRRPAFWH